MKIRLLEEVTVERQYVIKNRKERERLRIWFHWLLSCTIIQKVNIVRKIRYMPSLRAFFTNMSAPVRGL
jgi:hypothetical protein